MRELLYITKAQALAAGLKYEGTLYGVPAYFASNDGGEIAMATPKIPILHLWCMFADSLYELASYFMPAGSVLVCPVKVERPIQ